jgi:hypothetical protein
LCTSVVPGVTCAVLYNTIPWFQQDEAIVEFHPKLPGNDEIVIDCPGFMHSGTLHLFIRRYHGQSQPRIPRLRRHFEFEWNFAFFAGNRNDGRSNYFPEFKDSRPEQLLRRDIRIIYYNGFPISVTCNNTPDIHPLFLNCSISSITRSSPVIFSPHDFQTSGPPLQQG